MRLYAITASNEADLGQGNTGREKIREVSASPDAMLELRWEEPVTGRIVRIDCAGIQYPRKMVTGSSLALGYVRSIHGVLSVFEMDADGDNARRWIWQVESCEATSVPAPKPAPAPEPVPTPKPVPKPTPAPDLTELEEKRNALKAEIASMEARQKALSEEISRQEAKLEQFRELNHSFKSIDGEIRSIALKMKDEEAVFAQKQGELKALEGHLDECYADCEAAETRLETLRARHMDVDRAIKELMDLRKQKGMKDQETEAAENALRVAQALLSDKTGERDRLETEARALDAQNRETERANAALKAENGHLKADNARLERLNAELEQQSGEKLEEIKKQLNTIFATLDRTAQIENDIDYSVRLALAALDDPALENQIAEISGMEEKLRKCRKEADRIRSSIFEIVGRSIEN